MNYHLLRNLLFKLPPETSHHIALTAINIARLLRFIPTFAPRIPDCPVTVMGLEFPNPVGLAAGLDKNGDFIQGLAALGFGFIEVGTVTPRPQPGNPMPRLFRLPEHQAIINRMGFNNKGVDHLVGQLKQSGSTGIIGVNIGKNFDTPVENALDDYLICLQKVYQYADYITVNISSPNTPGLRDLQFGEPLKRLLSALKDEQTRLARQFDFYKPIAVKIAPDMTDEETVEVAETVKACEMDAVIATNTTLSRSGVEKHIFGQEAGGLSGAPLTALATHTVAVMSSVLGEEIPIIAVGGIVDATSCIEKVEAGASLVQIYTGFIYQGPDLIKNIVTAIARKRA
jgi:dihydroorotate dehydrogenase